MDQNLQHIMRVAQVGHAMNDARFARKKGRGESGQRGIFRAADLDRAAKRMPTVDANLIHTWQRENAEYLNNPVSSRCRGIFFASEARRALRSGRFRARERASRPVEDTAAPVRSVRRSVRHLSRWRRGRHPDRAGPRAKEDVDLARRYRANSR